MIKTWGCFSEAGAAEDSDGWITVRAQFNDEDDACFMVLGLGPRADVVAPVALRERIAADIAAWIQRARAK